MTIRVRKGQKDNDEELITLIQRVLNKLKVRQVIRDTDEYLAEAYIATRLYLDQNERDTSDATVRRRLARLIVNRIKKLVDLERKFRFEKLPKAEILSPQPDELQSEVAEFVGKAMALYITLSEKRPYKGRPLESCYWQSRKESESPDKYSETRNQEIFFQWLNGQETLWKKMNISSAWCRQIICRERNYWRGYASYYLPASVEVQRAVFGSENQFFDFPHTEEIGIETLRVMLESRWPLFLTCPTAKHLMEAVKEGIIPPFCSRYNNSSIDIETVRWPKNAVIRWLAKQKANPQKTKSETVADRKKRSRRIKRK